MLFVTGDQGELSRSSKRLGNGWTTKADNRKNKMKQECNTMTNSLSSDIVKVLALLCVGMALSCNAAGSAASFTKNTSRRLPPRCVI